jgi:hypothetical protein
MMRGLAVKQTQCTLRSSIHILAAPCAQLGARCIRRAVPAFSGIGHPVPWDGWQDAPAAGASLTKSR